MFKYAMKAAGSSAAQIGDRVRKFDQMSIEPMIELHLFGLEELYAQRGVVVRNCAEYPQAEYIVHYPVSDAKTGYLFDMYNDESSHIRAALALCEEIGSRSLVLHRCFGFNKGIPKSEATRRFYDKVSDIDRLAKKSGVATLFENYGFVWLSAQMGGGFVSSPLDHFFPWDIEEFDRVVKSRGLRNTASLIDIAHATLSSNMFNMLKHHSSLRTDRRFDSISDTDLSMRGVLYPGDFVVESVGWYHVSDSFLWEPSDGMAQQQRYLTTEGLPLGKGNIDCEAMFRDLNGDKVMVMEIEPENRDYENNASQMDAIRRCVDIYKMTGAARHVPDNS